MNSNIVLIGMPGSGKSTCGVVSAKMLLKNFYDTDLLIQNLEGRSLQEIINTDGVEYFAKAEETIKKALDEMNMEEIEKFIEMFLPAYTKTLDEISK